MIEKRKLNKAFKLMREAGLIAQQNFCCCRSCATCDLEKQVRQSIGRGEVCIGFAYYHAQDEDIRRSGDDFYIGYGPPVDEKGRVMGYYAPIGRLVCECLSKAGVPYQWNGRASNRIMVKQTARRLCRKRSRPLKELRLSKVAVMPVMQAEVSGQLTIQENDNSTC